MIQQLTLLFLTTMIIIGVGQDAQDSQVAPLPVGPGFDPKAIVGASECTECHTHSAAIWEKSVHHGTITDMPRSEKGREIAKKMGIRRIKSESLCLDCHSTSHWEDEKLKPSSGVSCESCHGAGMGWVKLHGEFSGKEEGQETADEIARRWRASEAAGMLRPTMIADIARNCVSCHVVPHEELVNVGGHPAGSDFELVAWSQGNIRHNNFYTKGKENKVASIERQRLLFAVGMLAEMELLLKAVGTAEKMGDYAKANARRFAALRKKLAAAAKATSQPDLIKALEAVASLKLSLKNQEAILAASESITASLDGLAATSNGSDLKGIDSMLPEEADYK
ncbi:MAG: hypothetical protein CBC13_04365 [Planctomycetia bacterium TMED53]|nr:MAG: hypothetical protein CBC13_04365 [Planctomycetia bacterium TMED53]